jgi:hypothetical protein
MANYPKMADFNRKNRSTIFLTLRYEEVMRFFFNKIKKSAKTKMADLGIEFSKKKINDFFSFISIFYFKN